MINRDNWKHVKAYLVYRGEVDFLQEKSMRLEQARIRHLWEWADDTPFLKVAKLRPTFPEYLLTARLDGQNRSLSDAYAKKVLRTAKRFFVWLSRYRRGYKRMDTTWLDTLKRPRRSSDDTHREAVTLEEVRAMMAAPAVETWELRIQAAAAFMFLSGIRVGAFVSLRLNAVNVQTRTIYQWPRLGVRTKFGKHTTTHLLKVTDLLEIVGAWDDVVRAALPPDGFWFAPISPVTGLVDPTITEIGKNRTVRVRKDLQTWLAAVGLPYYKPHAFRHGHATYALQLAQDVGDLKAISQNLMHASLTTTDSIYSILEDRDVGKRIADLGREPSYGEPSQDELVRQAERLLEQLKRSRH